MPVNYQYPITDLYAWIIDDPSGVCGLIGTAPSVIGPMQGVTSRLHVAQKLEPIARAAARDTGHTVRLQRFTIAETLMEVTPLSHTGDTPG